MIEVDKLISAAGVVNDIHMEINWHLSRRYGGFKSSTKDPGREHSMLMLSGLLTVAAVGVLFVMRKGQE